MNADPVFRALADPNRRAILRHLSRGEASVSSLAAPLGISLPGVNKHLGVLHSARLVTREKRGRTTYCRLQPEPLREAADWLRLIESDWNARLDRLAALLADSSNPNP